jgi:hypothetical protein
MLSQTLSSMVDGIVFSATALTSASETGGSDFLQAVKVAAKASRIQRAKREGRSKPLKKSMRL